MSQKILKAGSVTPGLSEALGGESRPGHAPLHVSLRFPAPPDASATSAGELSSPSKHSGQGLKDFLCQTHPDPRIAPTS